MLCRLPLYPLFNFIAVFNREVEKPQTHAGLLAAFTLKVLFPDDFALATNCVPGTHRQGQFNQERFSRFTGLYSGNKQSAAADVLGVTKKGFMTIATGDLLHNQGSPYGTTLILLFRNIFGIISLTHHLVLTPANQIFTWAKQIATPTGYQ